MEYYNMTSETVYFPIFEQMELSVATAACLYFPRTDDLLNPYRSCVKLHF